MVTKAEKRLPSYHLLNQPEVGERGKNILGAVVPSQNASEPFQSYRPNMTRNALPEASRTAIKELWQDVWKDNQGAVSILDYIADQKDEYDSKISMILLDKLKMFAKQRVGTESEIIAGEAKLYTIDNPEANLEDLYVKCKPWFDEVRKLWEKQRGRDLYLVTGVQICKNLKVRYEVNREIDIGGGGGVSNASVGIPAPGDVVKIEASHKSSQKIKEEQRIEEEVVFAVRYHQLKPVFESSTKSWSFWLKSKVITPSPATLTGFDVVAPVKGNLRSSYASADAAPQADLYLLEPLYVEAQDRQIDEHEHDTIANGQI